MKKPEIDKDSTNLIERFAHKIRNPIHSMGINLEVIKIELNRSNDPNLTKLNKHISIVCSELDTIKKMIAEFAAASPNAAKSKQPRTKRQSN